MKKPDRRYRRGEATCYRCKTAPASVLRWLGDDSTNGVGLNHPDYKGSESWICGDCLTTLIANGQLVLMRPAELEELQGAAGDVYSVPVTTEDDGSITIGDLQVRW